MLTRSITAPEFGIRLPLVFFFEMKRTSNPIVMWCILWRYPVFNNSNIKFFNMTTQDHIQLQLLGTFSKIEYVWNVIDIQGTKVREWVLNMGQTLNRAVSPSNGRRSRFSLRSNDGKIRSSSSRIYFIIHNILSTYSDYILLE